MSMDQYIGFPVETMDDWCQIKVRYNPHDAVRYEPNWQTVRVPGWRQRHHPLIFGPNCSTLGFYWFARELMGTERLSYAWYDQPALMHDMMDFQAEFLIAAARPILEHTTVEYVNLSEDMAMKTGPLLSPATYKTFIYPRLRRVVDFFKAHGARYVCVDTDGNPELLIPQLMDAGVDVVWPLERSAGQDPLRLRKAFGRSLRLWGGVDKRVLAQGPAAIDEHLRALAPLVEEGGYIPAVDHTVPPDVSWPNFTHYMESKLKLLRGEPF
jgi:uroporphyrinogen-III decarboxylase